MFLIVEQNVPAAEELMEPYFKHGLIGNFDLSKNEYQIIVAGPYQADNEALSDEEMYKADGCKVFWNREDEREGTAT